MLVVSRRKDEAIIITPPNCEPIRLSLIDVKCQKVVIGIDAPKDVVVDREEVHYKKLKGLR